MSSSTILLIALATICALGLVFFSYFYKAKKRGSSTYVLAGFRFLSVFLLLLLLINPEITRTSYETVKPELLLAVDRSASLEHLGRADSVRIFTRELLSNPQLREKFEISIYGFGKDLQAVTPDSLVFEEPQTNISGALKGISRIHSGNQSALLLITDGNQTLGEEYEYFTGNRNSALFPVAVGDTAAVPDLSIQTLNVNRYAFLNNRFPVEVILNYSGKIPLQSRFEIRSGSSVLYSVLVDFDIEQRSKLIRTTLPAAGTGTKFYNAVIEPLPSEKNRVNNSREFAVEVVNEQSSVLILSAVSHPDLGAIKKAIEANEQRQATIKYLREYSKGKLNDFQLVVLYQPNAGFKEVFDELQSKNLNYLLFTGTQTNWEMVNMSQQNFRKEATSLPQEVFAAYNPDYSRFQFEDTGFDKLPPLTNLFGKLSFQNENYDVLLFQQVQGISTGVPLLVSLEESSRRKAAIFGEDIWKWRMHSFVETGSFESFDSFFGKLIQYLSGGQKRDRLTFESAAVYYSNEEIKISAQFYDENFVFKEDGKLLVSIKNRDNNQVIQARLLSANNHYGVEIGNLPPGDYDFEIREETSNISRSGSFKVLELDVEQQFVSANTLKLKNLAANNSSNLYFLDDPELLIQELTEDNRFATVQKSREKVVPFSDWKFLLALLMFSLAAEWFTRKYLGLI